MSSPSWGLTSVDLDAPRERRPRKPAVRYLEEEDEQEKKPKPRRSKKKATNKKRKNDDNAATATTATTATSTANNNKKMKREWTYKEKRDRYRWNKVVETIGTCTNPTTVKHTVIRWFGCKGIPLDEVAIQACFKALRFHAQADPKTTAVCVVLLNSLANFASDKLPVGKPEYRKLLLDCGFVAQIAWFLERFSGNTVMVECGLFALSTVLGSHTSSGGDVSSIPPIVPTVVAVLSDFKQEASIASLACIALRNLLVANPSPSCAHKLLQVKGLPVLSETLACHPNSLVVASSAVPALLQLATVLSEEALQKVVHEEPRLVDQVILALLRFGNSNSDKNNNGPHDDTQKEDLDCLLEHGFKVLSNITKISPVGRKLVLEGGFHGLLEIAMKETANARVQENFLSILWYGAQDQHPSVLLLQGRQDCILTLVLEALNWHPNIPAVVAWAFDVLAACFQHHGSTSTGIDEGDDSSTVINSRDKIVKLALPIVQMYTEKLEAGTRNESDQKDALEVLGSSLKALQSPIVMIRGSSSSSNLKALVPAVIHAMKVSPLDSDVQEQGCALLLSMVSGDDRTVLSAVFGDPNQASIMHLGELAGGDGRGEIQEKSDALLAALGQQIMTTMKSCPVNHNVQKQGCDFLVSLIPKSQGVGTAMLDDDDNEMIKHLTKLANNFAASSNNNNLGDVVSNIQPKWESVLAALYEQDGEAVVQKVTEAKNDLLMFGFKEAFEFVMGIKVAKMKPEEKDLPYDYM